MFIQLDRAKQALLSEAHGSIPRTASPDEVKSLAVEAYGYVFCVPQPDYMELLPWLDELRRAEEESFFTAEG